MVVIGSGATASTLVPELAKQAAHVVMLQRSPTYVVSAPARDPLAALLRGKVSPRLAYDLTRWKNVLVGALFFQLARRAPRVARERLIQGVREALGTSVDVDRHFTPRYGVWDQRVCLVPDGDLFDVLRSGRAEVVTDHIQRIGEQGVVLQSGRELPADIIVKATGLELELVGGCELQVDGRSFDFSQSVNYKGCMFSGLPNFAYTFGYTNASWTLKADLVAEFVCRLLNRMQAQAADSCMPREPDPGMRRDPFIDFSSGYVQRGLARFPRQGAGRPYRLYQNYLRDLLLLRHGRIEDGVLELRARPGVAPVAQVSHPEQPEPPAARA